MPHNLKTVLYHGTISEIISIDVSIGKSHKDFGKGFYMAVTKQQAIGMMHKKYREYVHRKSRGFAVENLYEIVLDDDTAFCLKAFSEGAYGDPDSDRAQQILLENLETDNLGVQYFIGNQEIADKLVKSIRKIDWR